MSSTDLILAAAGTGGGDKFYVDDVFSTYLYTGNSSTQTITNNIDLADKGGMVWIKSRTTTFAHALFDTVRGATKYVSSNTTTAETTNVDTLTSFNSNGFSIGSATTVNYASDNIVSWTFAKQEKFFDVVTYTGNGAARTIAHNLGSAPGMIIVKRLDSTNNGFVYHRSLTSADYYLVLNSTAAQASADIWNGTAPTSSVFSLGTAAANTSGATYVAYLFAHDAGGFGESGEDNVISCGSFTTDGSGSATIDLGYEPQWLLTKPSSTTGNWLQYDTMRLWSMTGGSYLTLNSTAAESASDSSTTRHPTATGFVRSGLSASQTYIYMAIRRPMKVPTTGTEVFSPNVSSAAQGTKVTTGFTVDMQIESARTADGHFINDRLRGVSSNTTNTVVALNTTSTAAENTELGVSAGSRGWDNTGFQQPYYFDSTSAVFWNFRRASGFFDVVCYTGTGVVTNYNHNLGVVPELYIIKNRSNAGNSWFVAGTVLSSSTNSYLLLNTDALAQNYTNLWQAPTSTTFGIGSGLPSNVIINASGSTYVAYLFASCPGVSKVGSYTGTGATQTINCGFTGGARFVLIKRTDSTGDWYVWDTARGIISGNDPYLLMNSTAAEVTSTDYIDPVSSGFEISSSAPAAINASGGSFIFLAVS